MPYRNAELIKENSIRLKRAVPEPAGPKTCSQCHRENPACGFYEAKGSCQDCSRTFNRNRARVNVRAKEWLRRPGHDLRGLTALLMEAFKAGWRERIK